MPVAALIVDNPLRDLDGMVLLAATLARQGTRAVLVPMYEQGFDIPALRPDVVVANYVRANNRDLLAAYRRLGMRIVVLDSEGAAGRTPEDYARMVARMEPASLVDDYCVWGRSRHAALLSTGALPAERVHLTGCPRYDFCAPPWSSALAVPGTPAGYILVNTNFPLPNPRFAASAEDERRTLERVWKDPAYVAAVNREARAAFEGMLRAIEALARRFPQHRVIVRPHPFESTAPYESIAAPNVDVRQEGTSLQWIHGARLLVHQNCLTAVEAVMLARQPISLEWLSTPALRLPGPSAVSLAAASQTDLEHIVAGILSGAAAPSSPELEAERRRVVEDLFYANDGRACERAAAVIQSCAARAPRAGAGWRREPRALFVDWARRSLGYAGSQRLRALARGPSDDERRRAKSFSAASIGPILGRIDRAAANGPRVAAGDAPAHMVRSPRLFSGKSVLVRRAA